MAMKHLAPTLDETYKRILDNIDEESKETARRTLLWLALSKRPLRLSEVAEAVIIQIRTFEIDDDERLMDPHVLLETCDSLIQIQNDEIVSFAHYSVKEFMMSGRACSFNIDGILSEQELAESCLTYLLLNEMMDDGPHEPRDICGILDHLPLWEYASCHFWGHATVSGVEDRIFDLIIKYLLPGSTEKSEAFLQIFHGYSLRDYYRSSITARKYVTPHLRNLAEWKEAFRSLHIAAALNLVQSAKRMLSQQTVDVNTSSYTLSTPLLAATMGCNEDMVSLLLEWGASANPLPVLYLLHDGNPLAVACARGLVDIVQSLLKAGADVNGEDWGDHTDTPITAAVTSRNFKIVELLLDWGAEISTDPIRSAISNQDWECMELLLSRNPSFEMKFILDDLVHMKSCERVDAILLYLKRYTTSPGDLSLAFSSAVITGNIEILSLLLKHGADINQMNNDTTEYNPIANLNLLQAACIRGDETVFIYLLEHGANITAESGIFGTALQAAALSGSSMQIVKTLLDKGVNCNEPAGPFGTALQAATEKHTKLFNNSRFPHPENAGKWDFENMSLLLDAGADPDPAVNCCSYISPSPITWAAARGRLDMLLAKGVDINTARRGRFATPMHAAASKAHLPLVLRLLEAGADVNVYGGRFWSALCESAAFESFESYIP